MFGIFKKIREVLTSEGEVQTPSIQKPEGKLTLAESELSPTTERSQAEVKELLSKLAWAARAFSKNYGIQLTPVKGNAWACGIAKEHIAEIEKYVTGKTASLAEVPEEALKPKEIICGIADLITKPEDELMGVLRHEVGHALHTDYRLWFQAQRLAKDEGSAPTDIAGLYNALEDPWINNREIDNSEYVRQTMTKLYARSTPEIIENINSQDLPRQLGLNIIYYWATGESIPTLKSPEVLKVFEEIRDDCDQFFVGKDSQENYERLINRCWPRVKPLIEKAREDEAKKELARNKTGSKLGDPNRDQGSGGGEQQQAQGQSGKGKAGEGSGQQQGLGKTGKDKLREDLDQQQKDLQKGEQQRQEASGQESKLNQDIDLSKLSKESKEYLQKEFDKLTPEQKQEFIEKAKKNLDKKNAKTLNKEGPAGIEFKENKETGNYEPTIKPAPKKTELDKARKQIKELGDKLAAAEAARQAAEEQAQQQAEAQRRAEEQAKLHQQDMQRLGFQESELELYRKYKELENSILGMIASFRREMIEFLPRHESREYGGEHFSGAKVDTAGIAQKIPVGRGDLFVRLEIVEAEDPKLIVRLQLDNTGSMQGEKMEQSLRAIIFWSRVLTDFGIPFAIDLFGTRIVPIKKFDEGYDDASKRIKAKLLLAADASHGSTDIGTPLELATKESTNLIRRYEGALSGIFLISDSGANTGKVGTELAELVERGRRNNLIVNFILSRDAAEVENAQKLFGKGNVVAPAEFKDLPVHSLMRLKVLFLEAKKRAQQ